jgi:hypothetical protein
MNMDWGEAIEFSKDERLSDLVSGEFRGGYYVRRIKREPFRGFRREDPDYEFKTALVAIDWSKEGASELQRKLVREWERKKLCKKADEESAVTM